MVPDMKTLSIREFFRQPRRVQELIERGQSIRVERHHMPVFDVIPTRNAGPARRVRRSVGVWQEIGYDGDPAAPIPPEENWR